MWHYMLELHPILHQEFLNIKNKLYSKSFTAKYNCTKLVYYRKFEFITNAIVEEKRIKGGSRLKKEALISTMNPDWKDLYDEIKYL